MKDFRVLHQYLDIEGHAHFVFTTVFAEDGAEAMDRVYAAYGDNPAHRVIQIVESNGEDTGFTDEEIHLAMSGQQVEPPAHDGSFVPED